MSASLTPSAGGTTARSSRRSVRGGSSDPSSHRPPAGTRTRSRLCAARARSYVRKFARRRRSSPSRGNASRPWCTGAHDELRLIAVDHHRAGRLVAAVVVEVDAPLLDQGVKRATASSSRARDSPISGISESSKAAALLAQGDEDTEIGAHVDGSHASMVGHSRAACIKIITHPHPENPKSAAAAVSALHHSDRHQSCHLPRDAGPVHHVHHAVDIFVGEGGLLGESRVRSAPHRDAALFQLPA